MNAQQIIEKLAGHDIDLYLADNGSLKAKAPKGAITSELGQLIKSHKSTLVAYLAQLASINDAQGQTSQIPAVKRDAQPMAVSFAQQRLWFIDNLQGGSAEYNMPMAFTVTGQLDTARVKAVFNTIFARHEILRTRYIEADGATLQLIRPISTIAFDIKLTDLSHLSGEVLEAQVKALAQQDAMQTFDLATDLMLRVSYINKTADSGLMTFNMHHIASDGWSMEVLIKEFFALYAAYSQGKANPLAELEIQYADYALWQRDTLQGERLTSQLDYWQVQLAELPAVHSLPLDYSRPEQKQYEGALVESELSPAIAKALLGVAEAHKLTPFMLLHGALCLLLSRHSNSDDIVIGTPVANRRQTELEPLIGFFINTLILRADTHHDTLSAYFGHIRQLHLDAQSNQDVPFEQLVERLNVSRSTAHTPLFQIMMTTSTDYGLNDDAVQAGFALPGVDIQPYQADLVQAKFDLSVDLSISQLGLSLSWNYDVSLFTKQHISQLNGHLCRLLEGLSQSQTNQAPYALPLLSAAEIQQQIFDINETAVDYADDQCIHHLFEQQAAKNPDNVAIVFEGGKLFEGDQLSYQQLNERANQLAHYLTEQHHISADSLVGLCLERSLEMVIAIMAILKAGGAYVPLDPAQPPARLAYMLEDTGLAVVLTQSHLQEVLADFTGTLAGTLVALDGQQNFCASYAKGNLTSVDTGLTASNLAYVIYTSGSTGQPKGVMVEHQALFNRIDWMNRQYGMSANDKVLQKTPYSFDVSVWEFVWTLGYGGQLVMARPEGHKDPEYLCQLIQRHGISKLHFVPSMLEVILATDEFKQCHSIEQVFCSGEALQLGHVQGFRAALPAAQLHNLYGPTEAAIDVSYWDCGGDIAQGVPIGRPIANIQLLIVDRHLNLVPQGAVGELHIGGDGLARGYLNQAALTAERFIKNPYYQANSANSSARLYKTGDLARIRADGEIEYQGRTDHQVKIRGLRIELGEIEHQLGSLASVDSALVLAKELAGSMQLVGYVLGEVKPSNSNDDISAFVTDLKTQLADHLADYMIPKLIMVVEQWPLTANGKVDRKALPSPDGSALQGQYLAPQTAVEQVLVDIWALLLQLDPESISTSANFFALGGHSLMALKWLTLAREQNIEFSMQEILNHRDLQSLAAQNSQRVVMPVSTSRIPLNCAEITPQMLDLIELTAAELAVLSTAVVGGSENIADIYPLAPLQLGFLYQSLIAVEHDPYITYQVFNLHGDAVYQQFMGALTHLVSAHDILRTSFHWQSLSQPVQVVHRAAQLPLTRLADADDAEQVINQRLQSRSFKFDLNQAPLLNLSVCKKPHSESYTIGIEFHHLVDDAIAIGIFIQQIGLYMQGQAVHVPAEKQFRQYIERIHNEPQGEADDYFGSTLAAVEAPCLMFDIAESAGKQQATQTLDDKVLQSLKQLVKTHQLSIPVLVHAAWAMVVSVTTSSDRVVFGTILSGRMGGRHGTEDIVGPLINTLPLVVDLAEDDPLAKVAQGLKKLVQYEYFPLSQANAHAGYDSTGEIFNSIVNYRYAPADAGEAPNDVEMIDADEQVHYPFNLNINDDGIKLDMVAYANPDIGAARILDYFIGALTSIVEALTDNHSFTLNQLKQAVMPKSEQTLLVDELNQTSIDYPQHQCIHELFEQQAAAYPDHVAVVFGDSQLSYQQLNESANQLAHYLKENHHVQPDTLVGLCVERSLEMMIAILAILKAGGAYVPLDPNYPQSRLAMIVADAALGVVLCQGQHQSALPSFDGSMICIDGDCFDGYASSNLTVAQTGVTASNLAYVNYTSGSTGQPKGVLTEHISVTRLVINPDFISLNRQTVMLQCANIAFDAVTLEIWGPLLNGGQSILYPHQHLSLADLNAVIEQYQVNALWLTAGLFREWSYDVPTVSSLTTLLAGGDVLDADAIKRVQLALPTLTLINGYGPTENTTFSTTYTFATFDPSHTLECVPIGKKLASDVAYVLDDAAQLVPYGMVGELYVGGDGLARGYLNHPKLTAERFIANPFYDGDKGCSSRCSSARLYRTGDRVRYLADGNLAFVGRADDQVKIRGFRIELGEVETKLAQLDGVDSALVLAQGSAGHQQLVGYVKPQEAIVDSELAAYVNTLRTSLAQQLPEYMVPKLLMMVDEWPLTANGKVDRKMLPTADGSVLHHQYIAPQTATQQALVEIWSDLLDIKAAVIGTNANFFELGGHSLLVMRLLAAIMTRFNIQMDVETLLKVNDLADLGSVIDNMLILKQPEAPVLSEGVL